MGCLKDSLEIIYYVAFIVLTILIVRYSIKTYNLESEKKYELLCKISIRKETLGGYMFGYGIEIYNSGNIAAKDIEVIVNGWRITTVDFIQPNDSVLYPVGSVIQTLGGNHLFGESIVEKKGESLDVTLIVNGEVQDYSLCTDILFDMKDCRTGTLNDIKQTLDKLERTLNQKLTGR